MMMTTHPELRIERALDHLGRIVSDLGWATLPPVSPDNRYAQANMGTLVRWCQEELMQALADLRAKPNPHGPERA